VSLGNLQKISKALGITLSELFKRLRNGLKPRVGILRGEYRDGTPFGSA